jgi:recombination protein RecA
MAKKDQTESEAPTGESSRISKFLTSDLAKKVIKAHGNTALAKATEARIGSTPRFSTGIFNLDYALGGGWPTRLVHTVYGPKSSGKTSVILRGIGEYQKVCADCCTGDFKTKSCVCGAFRETVGAFIDVEGTWDQDWAWKLGCDPDRIVLSRPEYGEQAIDIAEAFLRSGEFDVLALDSLAFLVPMKEIENSVEQDMMGVQPRLIGKFVRKVVAGLAAMERTHGRRPTILFTNQIRMKLGVMFGNPETTPGGNAPGFASAIEVKMWPGKYNIPSEKDGGSGLGKPDMVEMNFRVEKNKTAVAKIEGTYKMCLSEIENKVMGNIIDEHDIVLKAEKVGALTGSGSSYTMFDVKYKGKTDLEQQLMYDPVLKKEIVAKLLPLLAAAV